MLNTGDEACNHFPAQVIESFRLFGYNHFFRIFMNTGASKWHVNAK